MQLESMTPAHGTLSVLGKTGKDLIKMPSYIVTYRNHRAVNERYTSTFAEGMELHEQHHLKEHTEHEFYKTVIGDGSREFMPEPPTDTVLIILLEITTCTEMIDTRIVMISLSESLPLRFLQRLPLLL